MGTWELVVVHTASTRALDCQKEVFRPRVETRTGAVCMGNGTGLNSLPVNITSNTDGGQFDNSADIKSEQLQPGL